MKKVLIPTLLIVALFAVYSYSTNYTWTKQATQSQKIGFGAVVSATATGSIAISSCDGMAKVDAVEACQIGTGLNETDGTFQYRDKEIIDEDGGLGIEIFGIMHLKYAFWSDDFFEGGYYPGAVLPSTNGAKFAETADIAPWLVSIVDGDGDNDEVIVINDDGAGGILKMETTDKALDSIQAQLNGEAFLLTVGKKMWFNTRFAIEDVSANTNAMGLSTADTDVIDSHANDHILFYNCGGDLYFSIAQDGTATALDTGVDLGDGTNVVCAFAWDGVDTITVAVNGTTITNLTDNGTTIVFPDDEELSPVMATQTTDTGKDYMLVDYIGCWSER